MTGICFKLPNECSEMRWDGTRDGVVLIPQAAPNVPKCEKSNAPIESGTQLVLTRVASRETRADESSNRFGRRHHSGLYLARPAR
jgi:hypothetical protein